MTSCFDALPLLIRWPFFQSPNKYFRRQPKGQHALAEDVGHSPVLSEDKNRPVQIASGHCIQIVTNGHRINDFEQIRASVATPWQKQYDLGVEKPCEEP